jgi:hypothetical protein
LEDDFEKADFFTKPFVKTAQKSKTARVQWLAPPDLNAPGALWVTCGIGRCILDTGSDVSLALRGRLSRNCLSPSAVEISHLEGCTILQEMGTLHLDDPLLGRPSPGIDGVFAVDSSVLPGALLGVPDIRRLALSLDYVLAHPGCDWHSARPSSCFDVCLQVVGVRRYRSPFVTAVFQPIPEQLEKDLGASLPGGRPVDQITSKRSCGAHGEPWNASSPSLGHRQKPGVFSPPPAPGPQLLASVPAAPEFRQRLSRGKWFQRDSAECFAALELLEQEERLHHHRGKWHAVRRGRRRGVFSSWAECEPEVNDSRAHSTRLSGISQRPEPMSWRARPCEI